MKKYMSIIIFFLILNTVHGNTQNIQVSLDQISKEGYIADETLIGILKIINTSYEEITITTRGIKAETNPLPNYHLIYTKENNFKILPNESKEIEVFVFIPRGKYEGKYNADLEVIGKHKNGNLALAVIHEVEFIVKKERFTIEEFNQQKQEINQLKNKVNVLENKNRELIEEIDFKQKVLYGFGVVTVILLILVILLIRANKILNNIIDEIECKGKLYK